MSDIRAYFKFFLKTRIVAPLRSLFLFLFGDQSNKNDWGKRMLLINLEGIGDLVVFSGVLKHYRRRFPGKEIYLLAREGIGVDIFFRGFFVDEIILIKYRRFSLNPFYGFRFINRLRRIGFEKVINHDFSAAEINGKIIGISLGARETIAYEGIAVERTSPFDVQQKKNLRIVRERIFPRCSRIIPGIEKDAALNIRRLKSSLAHYIAIYEAVSGARENDYATFLPLGQSTDFRAEKILEKFGLVRRRYAILNVNASAFYKCWPLERFLKAAEFLDERNVKIVLLGARKDKKRVNEFEKLCRFPAVNLAGLTSFEELVFLIKNSLLVLSNDTSAVHIAVALKTPSLSIVGGGQFGMFSNYGYADINYFVYQEEYCFGDNWRCGRALFGKRPSPCIEAVTFEKVVSRLASLLDYVRKTTDYPRLKFSVDFPTDLHPAVRSLEKLKIIYAGIEAENYEPRRKPSFEYSNFYLTLKGIKNWEVLNYPYDRIIKLGREKFNRELLELVKAEKPDIFFAFMFTDELDKKILKEIKKLTTSFAWFADDHWRLYNYSRFYAPYFTWAITTWSKAPAVYRSYGITNVIRSQWACNPNDWRPLDIPKDIAVSFVGQRTKRREKVIEELRRAGIDIYVRGWGWPEGIASREEMIKIFSRSKINLNINEPPDVFEAKHLGRLFLRRSLNKFVPSFNLCDNFKSWKAMSAPQIKARPFELSACGAFVISGYADDMENYFREDKEMIFYRTTDDLIKKIKYFLPLDAERQKIALAGYQRTLAQHTYKKRFEDIFNMVVARPY